MSASEVGQALSLEDAWALRNSAAETLLRTEQQLERLVKGASPGELTQLLESFAPSRSPGPEWSRLFDALLERLWAWCDDATMAALHADFADRGPPWAGVAGALSPDRGATLRARLQRPAYARMPHFTLL